MIANSAFLAGLTTFVLAAWLAAELSFLAPYKAAIFRTYGLHILVGLVLVFVNFSGAYYLVARWLFLRDAGRNSVTGHSHAGGCRRAGGRLHRLLAGVHADRRRRGRGAGHGGGRGRCDRSSKQEA